MQHPTSPLHSAAPTVRAGLLALVIVAVTACGTTPSPSPTVAPSETPTASPAPSSSAGPTASADLTAIYDAIERQVIEIRGLQPTRPVERAVLSEEELRTILTQMFDEDTPPEYLAANERLYKALGLMAADDDLRDLSLDLLSTGVAGFYRSDQNKLYVVSRTGEIGGNEKVTYAHEYGHALQDQTWTVFKDQDKVLDQSDWIMARQAAYEGDATMLMTEWMLPNLSPDEIQDILSAGTDPEAAEVMARIPPIMTETLLFPYTTGAAFVGQVRTDGGWPAVDALYDRLPESTEQILHPEKYASAEAPFAVDLPDDLATRLGSGWSVPLEDTFGEFQTGIWLRETGVEVAAATDAAAGWGGDRLAVIAGPDDTWALAWQTAWDTPADAAAFETAATTALAEAGGIAQVLPGDGGTTRWVLVASDAATMSNVAGALGLAG